jgi:cell shape-determining protein MreC
VFSAKYMSLRKRYLWILIACVAVLAILIFFEPAYGWQVRGWLNSRIGLQLQETQTDDQSFAAQNEALQAQLAELQGIAAQIPQNPQNQIRAMVYVQYPFGFKNELLVNAGSNQSVVIGKAVTFQGIFIGTVTGVFPDSAVVQTIFDPAFKMPVRIGAQSYDALVVGGADPKATSIAKDAEIVSGDVIYTAAAGLPYGLPVGVINATSTSGDNLFEEASVNFGYDINAIQSVLIQR